MAGVIGLSAEEGYLKHLRQRLERLYRKEMFTPALLGRFINPYYFARRGLVDRIAELGCQITGRTLDIGCGLKPYQHLCRSSAYVGLELDSEQHRKTKSADCYYDGRRLPFDDEQFDSILSSQVFEHVFTPDEFLAEAHRVLKPGGKFLLSVPFLWDEHEIPFDFARYTSFGLQFLLKKHGFEIIEFSKTNADIRAVIQLLNIYVDRSLGVRNPYIKLAFRILLTGPFNFAGELLWRITPRNEFLYLDNVVLAKR